MKVFAVVLLLLPLVQATGMADDCDEGESCESPSAGMIGVANTFFGTPVHATYGFYGFADPSHERFLPLEVNFVNPRRESVYLCEGPERVTSFIIEKENSGMAAILMGLIAAKNPKIIMVHYECVLLDVGSGNNSTWFAVIKNILFQISSIDP